MSQSSQIYVAYTTGKEADNEHILVARYFSWNYGSRMVSRAAGIINWIADSVKTFGYIVRPEKLVRIIDTNFDFRDVVISTDIIKEAKDYKEYGCKTQEEYIFNYQQNSDGKLFILVGVDGIKYAFTDSDTHVPLTAEEYMTWGDYSSEEDEGSHLTENIKTIEDLSQLMTTEELEAFLTASYSNVEDIKKRQELLNPTASSDSDLEYIVQVTEECTNKVTVYARSEEEAEKKAEELWNQGIIDVESESVRFDVVSFQF